jgi:hypothetical protein
MVLRGQAAGYSLTLTATTGRSARMVVFLARGSAGDEQTHTYVFRLPSRAVFVDRRLRRARLRASLHAFGSVRLSGVSTGKAGTVAPPTGCRGPRTSERLVRLTGKVRIRLPGIGTIRPRPARAAIDRPVRGGAFKCASPPLSCEEPEPASVDVSLPDVFLSATERTLFVSANSPARAPATSIVHTRTISQGVTLDETQDDTGGSTVALGVEGVRGVTGGLRFTGPRTTSADVRCSSKDVARVTGAINGRLVVNLAGYGDLAITGDGSAAAPVANYRTEAG